MPENIKNSKVISFRVNEKDHEYFQSLVNRIKEDRKTDFTLRDLILEWKKYLNNQGYYNL